jgi:hypothetical protein
VPPHTHILSNHNLYRKGSTTKLKFHFIYLFWNVFAKSHEKFPINHSGHKLVLLTSDIQKNSVHKQNKNNIDFLCNMKCRLPCHSLAVNRENEKVIVHLFWKLRTHETMNHECLPSWLSRRKKCALILQQKGLLN